MGEALFYAPESEVDRYQKGSPDTNGDPRGAPAAVAPSPSGVIGAADEGAPHNLLVVSDLHLGDSLRPSEAPYLQELARLNRALCRFLKHYARHPVDGRPWRLVIAGDMIDFLHAGLYDGKAAIPAGPVPAAPRGRPREQALVHCSEVASIAWLEAVMSRERRVFRVLASFVASGHELVVIKGNHDAQFHFEGVQRRFTELLLELHVRRLALRRRASDPALGLVALEHEKAAFVRRISFCRWFYYERDLVYIEHGNQYDAFCSFEHVLAPVDPEHFELEDPISHRTYREFALLLGSLDVHEADQWRLPDYVKWVASLGPRLIGRLFYTYFASISWLMRTKKRLLGAALAAKAEHVRLRKALTRRFALSEEQLHALDELRERPAGKSVFLGLNMLYMDRVALAALDVVTLGLAALHSGPAGLRAGVAGGVVLLSLLAHGVLEHYRGVDPHPKLIKMAHRIARLLKVPFVVFGHTHRALVSGTATSEAENRGPAKLGESGRSWYFNTGSWTSAGAFGLTHVCILRSERARAELRRWCPDAQRPLTLEAPAT
ncbi:metallophosphoesterase [Myxococcota bacterium]|nr:metallophosphoesterase [Myxococcota bacterium]